MESSSVLLFAMRSQSITTDKQWNILRLVCGRVKARPGVSLLHGVRDSSSIPSIKDEWNLRRGHFCMLKRR